MTTQVKTPRMLALFVACAFILCATTTSLAQKQTTQHNGAATKKTPNAAKHPRQPTKATSQRDAIMAALLQAFAQLGNGPTAAPTPLTIKTKRGMTIQIDDAAATFKQLWAALTKRKATGKKARLTIRTKNGKQIQFNDAGKSLKMLLALLAGK